MEFVANDTAHISFVSVHHVVVEYHFVKNLTSSARRRTLHRFLSHSTASNRATTTRWRCISATASAIHMRSTAYDAPSVMSSVSSLAACGLPCCVLMAPQCPSCAYGPAVPVCLCRLRRLLCNRASAGSVSPVASSGPGVHDVEHRWLGLPRRPPVPMHWPFNTRCHDGARVCVCALNATPLGFLIRNHADFHLPRRLSLGASRRPGGLRDRRRSPAVCT